MLLVEAWRRNCVRAEQESVDDVAKRPIGTDNRMKKCVLTGVEISHYIFSSQCDCRLFVGLASSFEFPSFLFLKLQKILL